MADIRKIERASGTSWQLRFRDHEGAYRYRSFPTKKQATEFLSHLGPIIAGEKDRARFGGTIGEAIDAWLDIVGTKGRHGREPVGAATLRKYQERAKNHLKPMLGATVIRDFDAPAAAKFRNDLLDRCARATAKKCLTDLKGALAEARSAGLMQHDPLSDIKIVDSARRTRRLVIPTRKEMATLESALRGKRDASHSRMQADWARLYAMLLTLRWTGCRPTEVRGMPDSAILWDRGQIRVMQGASEKGEIDAPKTVNGYRAINVPSHLLDALGDWMTIRGAALGGQGLLFPTANGAPVAHNNLTRWGWMGLIQAAELERPFTLYALRHYRISERLAAGENIHLVSEQAGHADAGFTLRVYGHVMKEGLE